MLLTRTPLSRFTSSTLSRQQIRLASTHHRFLIVGGGTAGTTVAAQLQRAFKSEGRALGEGEVAVVDGAEKHHYQPGWTLVGSGLAPLSNMSRPLASLIPQGVKLYKQDVKTFEPENNKVKTSGEDEISYDYLIVAPGLKTSFAAIPGLTEALQDPASKVSTIYKEDSVEKVWRDIQGFEGGGRSSPNPLGSSSALERPRRSCGWYGSPLLGPFSAPSTPALSQWKKDGKREKTDIAFATGGPAMFAVPKYAAALESLRKERNVEGLFNHNLVKIDGKNKKATFAKADGTTVEESYDLLHVTPPQCPPEFIKESPLADAAGWVSVNPSTTQHTKYPNVFSLGDASSMPNSKTAAAITAQAPVLVDNLRALVDGKELKAVYDGYASCPLLTGHNELMLAEFKYGGIPKETFSRFVGSQDKPNALFYYLKKDIFPFAYWNAFVKGIWFGPKAFLRPIAYMKE
ncbi:FAD/NAD(P)-binding domain-containing protein [Leucosporidium creatinivorum]|uniref:FAD/NAD(P)-binding domain-containing protein n=1 Tax=Leucosporidium creatinivorum TaxID=106004 RepID=A0A1Y2CJ97_9BASI|nr:FAD/NAD(P)-binding domain-containing protein [Leucosporidium creatinivorum]